MVKGTESDMTPKEKDILDAIVNNKALPGPSGKKLIPVVERLQAQGYLDEQRKPTKKGVEAVA